MGILLLSLRSGFRAIDGDCTTWDECGTTLVQCECVNSDDAEEGRIAQKEGKTTLGIALSAIGGTIVALLSLCMFWGGVDCKKREPSPHHMARRWQCVCGFLICFSPMVCIGLGTIQ